MGDPSAHVHFCINLLGSPTPLGVRQLSTRRGDRLKRSSSSAREGDRERARRGVERLLHALEYDWARFAGCGRGRA